MNELQKHYAKWKMPNKRLHSIWFCLYENTQKRKIYRVKKVDSCLLGVRGGNGDMTGYEESYQGDENVLKLDMVIVAQLGKFTKNHWIVYIKWVNLWSQL